MLTLLILTVLQIFSFVILSINSLFNAFKNHILIMRSQAPADLKGSITFKEKVIKKAKTALIINQDPKVILLNIV